MRNNGGPRWKKMMKSGSLNSLNLEHFTPFPDHRQSKTLLLKKPISAATDEPPNYMKSTSSSHQRRLSLDESCYLKLATSMSCSPKMPITKKVAKKDLEVTFLSSSSIKDSRFHPKATIHSPENQWHGTSVKACRYPSCSLHSSHQDNLLHPPKCFLTTQKTARTKPTSPGRTKTSKERKKDNHANQKDSNVNNGMESHDHKAQKDFDANLEEVLEKVKLQGHDHFNREILSELAGQMKEQEEAIEVKHVLVESERLTNRKDVLEYTKLTNERRNEEEWMLDYALTKAIDKLTPAQKKKVALLVEAFEMIVTAVSKCNSCIEQQIHLPTQDL